MRWRILPALVVCLLLAADGSKGRPAKKAEERSYAKVELKGTFRSDLKGPELRRFPTIQ